MQAVAFDVEDRATNIVDSQGISVGSYHDALGRVLRRTYADGAYESFAYAARGLVAYTNQLGKVTRSFYDEARRKTIETNANAEITQFKYDASGNLTNLIDGKGQNSYWRYDEHSQITNKLDALGTVIFRYSYDANHRLTNRWTPAKGDTFYTYDAVGNLTFVNYPASSDITLAYDALNRVTNMVDSVGTTRYGYDSVGQLLSEDGPWENDTVTLTYQDRLRTGLSVQAPNASSWSQSYGYDVGRRLASIASPAGSFTYTYHAGMNGVASPSSLVKILAFPSGANSTNAFDSVGRLTEIRLRNSGGTLLNQHDYTYNSGNQRTKQTRTAGDFVDYTYDDIGQVQSALGKESGGTTNRWQEQFGYAYDAAGNLNRRTNNALVQTFAVNNLNQISNATRSGTLTVAGLTFGAASSVTVNTLTADRYADRTFTRINLSLSDGNNTFTAVATDSLGRDDTNVITINLPATLSFLYDLNGNMRTNGTRILEYDDENQLTRITEPNTWKSEFVYDGKMKMRISRDYEWRAGAWVQTNEVRRVYDGMLVLQERNSLNVPTLTYTRGKDLSGSQEGAGGIGGLLSFTEHASLTLEHTYYHADGNGNLTALVSSNQLVVGRYLYDPFGNPLSATGPKAGVNKYRFSSKEWHAPSGMVYYTYRWYVPELQRWLNGDPIEEKGGINLFGFVRNDPISWYDLDGRVLPVAIGGGVVVVTVGKVTVILTIACFSYPPAQKQRLTLRLQRRRRHEIFAGHEQRRGRVVSCFGKMKTDAITTAINPATTHLCLLTQAMAKVVLIPSTEMFRTFTGKNENNSPPKQHPRSSYEKRANWSRSETLYDITRRFKEGRRSNTSKLHLDAYRD